MYGLQLRVPIKSLVQPIILFMWMYFTTLEKHKTLNFVHFNTI